MLSTGLCFIVPNNQELEKMEQQENIVEAQKQEIEALRQENKRLVDTIEGIGFEHVGEIYTYYPEQPSVMKSFMDYRAVTSTTSKQYHYRLEGYTLPDGRRGYNGRVQVAIGTPYAQVGDNLDIYLHSGEIINAVVADSKGDRFYHPDGSTIEFLVDSDIIPGSYRGRYGLNALYDGFIDRLEVQKTK